MSREDVPESIKRYFDNLLKRIVDEQKRPPDTVLLELRLTYDEAIAITTYLANLRGHNLEGKSETV